MQRFQWYQCLVMIKADGDIIFMPGARMKHRISSCRPANGYAFGTKNIHRRNDEIDLFASQRTIFASMGIESCKCQAGIGNPEIALQATRGCSPGRDDLVDRQSVANISQRQVSGYRNHF